MWSKATDTKRPSQVCLLPHLDMLQGQGRYSTAFIMGSVTAQLKVLMQLNCPTSFFSCSLDIWKHTEDPSLLSPLPFTDSLCDDPKVFQQRKARKAEDHLSALGRARSLDLRAAFLPTGSALVDWLISNSFAVSRFEAVTLASMLMEENFTKPVGARSTGATRYSDLSEQFLDDSTALYMFVSDAAANGCQIPLPFVMCLIWGSGKGDRGRAQHAPIGKTCRCENKKKEKLRAFRHLVLEFLLETNNCRDTERSTYQVIWY